MAAIPSQLIGRSVFSVKAGMLVGLHIKTANSIAVSVTQEPLHVALGTFRPTQLAELTNSSHGHIPTIVQAIVRVFESGNGIELIAPAPGNLVEALNARAMGMPAGTGEGDQLPPPATGVRIRFIAFATEYDITLGVKPCPNDAKDPFVWSLVMDLYRAMTRAQTQLQSAVATSQRLKASAQGTSPTRLGGARRAEGRPQAGSTAANGSWRSVNTSRGRALHNLGDPEGVEKPVPHRPGTGKTWKTALSSTSPRQELRRELLVARQQLSAADGHRHSAGDEVQPPKPAPRPDVRCVGVDTADLEKQKKGQPEKPTRQIKSLRIPRRPLDLKRTSRPASGAARVVGGVELAPAPIPRIDFGGDLLEGFSAGDDSGDDWDM